MTHALHAYLPQLRLLHVGSCGALVDLQLRCPRLETLQASLCFNLTGLQHGQVLCPALTHINLFGEWDSLQGQGVGAGCDEELLSHCNTLIACCEQQRPQPNPRTLG